MRKKLSPLFPSATSPRPSPPFHGGEGVSCRHTSGLGIRGVVLGLLAAMALGFSARCDPYDTLRLYWQNYLISSGGSASSINSAGNSDWTSMETSPTRTELWSDLPLGSVSANIPNTYSRLQAMALAWATPGAALHNNAGLAS